MDFEKMTADALLGQAVGDALGVPVEFLSRAEVRDLGVRDMMGLGDEKVRWTRWGDQIPRGTWSDDTSMTLASMASFVRCGGKIDHEDQMAQFVRWWRGGDYCCIPSFPFGLGGNVSQAMDRYRRGTPALQCGGTDLMDNGNGALMRILPFSLHCIFRGLSRAETARVISDASAMTHAHGISRMCCFVWTEFLRGIAEGAAPAEAARRLQELEYGRWFPAEAVEALAFIPRGETAALGEADIGETGYVVDTLKTALYSLLHTCSYEECILTAVNLGYDTDTGAAVAGTAAGLLYGAEQIPGRWMEKLEGKEILTAAARDFAGLFA